MRLAIGIFLLLGVSPAYTQLAAPNEAGLTFGHVHLNVSDPELHAELWAEHFGGVVGKKGALIVVKFPWFLIVLEEGTPSGGSQGTVLNHFGFKVRNLAGFLGRWRAAGYPVDREFTGSEGQPNGYVTMPDGVWVELQEDQGLPVEVAGYHVHYRTPDFENLLDWYVDVFGLEIRPRGRIETTTNVPGMNLSFATAEGPALPTRGRAVDHIGFELDDLDAFCERLAEKGISFDVEPHEIEDLELKVAAFTDPSGVRIELTEGLDRY